jgi:hypothetical protein
MSRIRDIANILSGSTDMATDAEVTSSIASHAAAADPHTVYLKTATASSTYAPLSNPTFTTIGGDEGGQINLGAAATNTTLSGPIALDINQNRLRFFESGGTNRGYYLDISAGAAGVGTNLGSSGGMTLIASGNTVNGASVITLSSIPTTYVDLVLYMRNFQSNANVAMNITFNNVSTAGAYAYQAIETGNTSVQNAGVSTVIQSASYSGATPSHQTILRIFDYTTTNSGKHFQLTHSQSTTGTYRFTTGYAKDTIVNNAVTRIDLALSNYSGTSGSYALYGVK